VNPVNGNPLYRKADGSFVQGNIPNNRYYVYDPENPNAVALTGAVATPTSTLSATDDRRILGRTTPLWQGGIINNFGFRGFDLEIFLRYAGGYKIMNVTRQETLANMGFQNNGREMLARWSEAGQETNVPRLWAGNEAFINNTGTATTRFVEDGDFLRVQNIVLGYRVPSTMFGGVGQGIKNLRLFAQVQNAFTWTKYSGLDPELTFSATSNSQTGVDYNTNPLIRSFTVGLNLGL
jgi:hypothetical protein